MNDDGTFTRATRLLRKTALDADEANQLIELIEDMTTREAARIIARVESKMDAQEKAFEQFKWFLALGIALAGVLASVFTFLLK